MSGNQVYYRPCRVHFLIWIFMTGGGWETWFGVMWCKGPLRGFMSELNEIIVGEIGSTAELFWYFPPASFDIVCLTDTLKFFFLFPFFNFFCSEMRLTGLSHAPECWPRTTMSCSRLSGRFRQTQGCSQTVLLCLFLFIKLWGERARARGGGEGFGGGGWL